MKRPDWPRLSGFTWVRKCMWVKLTHKNTGLPALTCFSRNSAERAAMSSSIVSIRFLVSGPVSSIFCVPSGWAKLWITPRGAKFLRKLGNSGSFGLGIVGKLRLLLGVEVVEIAIEFVETVGWSAASRPCRRDGSCRIGRWRSPGSSAVRRWSGSSFAQAESAPGRPTLLRPVRIHALSGDEGRTAGGAALLAVIIGENHAVLGDGIDIGRAIAHQAVGIGAEVGLADVVAPDDDDVRLFGFGGRRERTVRRSC